MLSWLFFLVMSVAAMCGQVLGAGYLDLPDACMILQDTAPGEIHLQRSGICNGTPGRAFVDNSPGEVVKVYVEGQLIGEQMVKELAIVDVKGVLDKGETMAKEMALPENVHTESMRKKAEEVDSYYTSSEFQSKIEEQTNSILNGSMGYKAADYYTDVFSEKGGHLANDERIYIFVSSSMPMSALRTYAADVAKLSDRRVQMVMRGFIGGMSRIIPTTNFVANVLKKDASCELVGDKQCDMLPVDLLIDPLLFQRYGIEHVPAFVYVKGFESKAPGGSEGFTANVGKGGEVLSISGDASLIYIVSKFSTEYESTGLLKVAEALR